MSLRRAAWSLLWLSAAYLAALLWADARSEGYSGLQAVAAGLPMAMLAAAAGWALRGLRWHWLLRRAGHAVDWRHAVPAYLAGFALTATPGKVGELLRIRYFGWQGVPAARVTAAFVYERALDLLCLLLLALPAAAGLPGFALAVGFVAAVVGAVAVLAFWPRLLGHLAAAVRRRGGRRLARWLCVLRDGLRGARLWLNAPDLLLSFALGLLAWGCTALALLAVLQPLNTGWPVPEVFPLYPLAMLAGAASLVPGGLVSTEAALTLLLTARDLPAATALTVALATRLGTLWWAIACGFACMAWLELRRR